jgi:mannose-6-phosphate isomerase-like protein (cupin superfamily)
MRDLTMAEKVTRRGLAASALLFGVGGAAQAHALSHAHAPLSAAEKERQAFKFQALKMFVEVDSDDTQGAVAVVRVYVPPGAGAAPHVHSREDELFLVVRGHYRFRHGDEEVDAPAGTTIYMPKGVPHTFRNIGDEAGEHLVTLVPGGLEKYFREVSAAGLRAPRDSQRLAAMAAPYGLRLLPPDALPLSIPR